jgi:glycerophosphoryl diester phosphodiesterase
MDKSPRKVRWLKTAVFSLLITVLLVLFFLLPTPWRIGSAIRPERARPPRSPISAVVIAHALGGINNHTYTNSRQAFENSYQRGCRWFEADFMLSSDGELVCLHGTPEEGKTLTIQQFRQSQRADPSITPLTADDLLDLMRKYEDSYLVTDVKNYDNARVLPILYQKAQAKGIDAATRIYPQIYNQKETSLITQLPYKNWILTLYRLGPDFATAVRIAKEYPEIAAITYPAVWYKDILKWRQKGEHRDIPDEMQEVFSGIGVRVYVHTVNQTDNPDFFLKRGIGLYTDDYFQKAESKAVATDLNQEKR